MNMNKLIAFAAVAASAAASAHAATYEIYWAGGSGTAQAPLNVYAKENWSNSQGKQISSNPGTSHNFNFTVEELAYLTGAANGKCNEWSMHGGDYSLDGEFQTVSTAKFGDTAGKTVNVVVNGGSFSSGARLAIGETGTGVLTVNGGTVTVGDELFVGGTSTAGGTGTLTINGGNVVVASGKNTLVGYATGATGTINLNGGVLTTTRVARFNGASRLNFNGGTLKVNATATDSIKDGVGITVLAGGGTIDCNGMDIAIDAQWSAESTGGMNFTGGNGNTILIGVSGNGRLVNYTGITSIASGTRLAVRNLSASKNVITNGIVVAGVPTVGDTIFTCTRGDGFTLDGVSLDNVKCPIAPGTTFALDDSKTNIVVTSVGALAPAFWTGKAGDNNLSTPGNWSDNTVPAGNATISCAAPATLTKGAAFAPTAITFAEGSAAVTIDGGDFTGIVAVTNLSSSSHTINAKVYFAGDIQVVQPAMGDVSDLAKPHVTFAGGAYAADGYAMESGDTTPVYSRCIFGEYFLRKTFNVAYSGKKRVCVADGAKLHVPSSGNLTALYIGTGAKVFVDKLDTTFDRRASYRNYGEMVVTNLVTTGAKTESGGVSFAMTYDQGATNPAVFKFDSITNSMTAKGGAQFIFGDANAAGKHVFYIGEGGVNFKDSDSTIFVLGKDAANNWETIRPWYSNFTFGARPGGSAALRIFRSVEFNTVDEGGKGRTITLEGVTKAQGTSPAIYVLGSGTLKVNERADNTVQPTVYVSDTSTLEYTKDGATLGTGSCAVGDKATLSLAASGTYSPGDLYLNNGSTLAFTLAGSADTTLSVTSLNLPENGKVTVSIGGVPALGRNYTLISGANLSDANAFELAADIGGSLSVESGNLVYTAANYFYIKVADAGRFSLKEDSGDIVTVDIPDSWLSKTGCNAQSSASDIAEALALEGANGIPVWKSYCLGLEPQNSQSKVLCGLAASQPSEAGSFNLTANLNVPENLSGVTVTAYLDRQSGAGGWTQQASAEVSSGSPVFTASADPQNALSFFA